MVVVGGGTVEVVELDVDDVVSATDVVVAGDELACRPTVLSPHDDPRIAAPTSNAANRTIYGTSVCRRLLPGADELAEDEVGDLAHLLFVLRRDDHGGDGRLLPCVETFADA